MLEKLNCSIVRKMKLRPYHPPYILAYLGLGPDAEMRPAMRYGVEWVRDGGTDLEIELVEEFDDICMRCARLEKDPAGSIWGQGYSCTSSRDPGIVKSVTEENKAILKALRLEVGAVLKASELFPLVAEKLPELGCYPQCGKAMIQDNYQHGLVFLLKRWGR